MSTHIETSAQGGPLDLSKWRNLPKWLMVLGGAGVVLGVGVDLARLGGHEAMTRLGYSWLVAFMFYLSLGLGGLGLVILHHLFDASWSVPIRRINEHLANLLFPWLFIMILPVAVLAPFIYDWMHELNAHDITVKYPLFTVAGYYCSIVFCFTIWRILASGLRRWSLKQDETGSVECTRMMRRYAACGVVLFAITLTLAAIMWMKALMPEWYSTMYGVWYFASSMWLTLFTLYIITYLLKRQGPLREVATDKTFYFIGSLMFAFTVFYAYVTFFQYFIQWNANIPEEVFWYVRRENGTWWDIGMVVIFGHFFLPFLSLLRIDVKISKLWVMIPLGLWAWAMHYVDVSFNIMPEARPNGFVLSWLDISCFVFIGGVLSAVFLKQLYSYPIIPQKDPRFAEAMDVYVEPRSAAGPNIETGGGH